MNQQRELIIRKINSNDETPVEEASDFDDEDDDDEEDAEMMELELDSGETLLKLSADEPIGEQLLLSEYSFAASNMGNNEGPQKSHRLDTEFLNDSTVINRPITPLNLRQSQQYKNKQQMTPRDSITPDKPSFQNVKNSVEYSNKNHNDNLKQGTLINNRVKSSTQHRSQSIDKKPPYSQPMSAGSRTSNDDRRTNILVIESNDIPVEDSYSTNASSTIAASRSFLANDSVNGSVLQRQRSFKNSNVNGNGAPPVQRQKSMAMNSSSVNIVPNPKYSITEPRPSSANSTKSKTSSSSSTINQESTFYNSQKRNGAKN